MTVSKIEWTEHTWNPIVGCSIKSPGCTHCYAMPMAARIEAMGTAPHYAGLTKKVNGNAVWTGKLALAPRETWLAPLKRKKPTMYFVNSMGDLLHEDIPDEHIDLAFAIMALAPQHTMQVLTKRADRLHRYMTTPHRKRIIAERVMTVSNMLACQARSHKARIKLDHFSDCFAGSGPFKNVWLGVSAERQQEADERIPLLLQTPAAIRFVSCEPLLGPIDLYNGDLDPRLGGRQAKHTFLGEWWEPGDNPKGPPRHGVDWVIAGGESGRRARPMHPDWARSLRDQCAAAGVPFFFKQWGEHAPARTSGPPEASDINRLGDHMVHVGKKAAGALLDGREHRAFPEVAR